MKWRGNCGSGGCSARHSVALVPGTLLFREDFLSVSPMPGRKPNTEVTKTLRDLCVKAFEAQSTRRRSFWLRHRGVVLLRAFDQGGENMNYPGAVRG
jgi:hypothetical protein